jgi:hypothetical protein
MGMKNLKIGYLVNNEFQRVWEEAIICIVSVELDDMTKDCGLLVTWVVGSV